MSAKRRANEPPLSLFSFQDIITSISGILILLTLMMALELIERVTTQAPPPAPTTDLNAVRQEVDQLKEQVALARTRMDSARASVMTISEINFAELPLTIEREQARESELKNALAEALRQRSEAERATAAATAQEEQLRRDAQGVEEKIRSSEALPSNRVVFSTARQATGKTPVLVECDREGIGIKIMSAPPQVISFRDPRSNNHNRSLTQFRKWAQELRPGRHAIVFLIKPSACGYADTLADEMREAPYGLDVGTDALEEERTAIF